MHGPVSHHGSLVSAGYESEMTSEKNSMQHVQQEIQQPQMLQALGHKVFDFMHYAAAKALELPKPLSSAVWLVEEIVQPVAQLAEDHSLRLLRYLDQQLYNVGEAIENAINLPKNGTRRLVGEMQRRGIVGSAADLWVEHEKEVMRSSEKLTRFLARFPGFGLVAPAGAFTFNRFSQWLVQHSEVHMGKLQQPVDDEHEGSQEEMEFVESKVDEPGDEKSHGSIVQDQSPKQQNAEEEEDEVDELTKLIDAGWCLGSV